MYNAELGPQIDPIPKDDTPFVMYKCVTCTKSVTTSYHPPINPIRDFCLVVSGYESHERTCVTSFLGASPDTWPTNFNSPVLHGRKCLTLRRASSRSNSLDDHSLVNPSSLIIVPKGNTQQLANNSKGIKR